ncbi:MAG: hypothetical protein CMJ48_13775 [Planctomycetaceae bacterium]|nr:hypothetical protein [Planctomycetaceae bacterium]
MKKLILAAVLVIPLVSVIVTGCGPQTSSGGESDFAPGAFPPILTDMEYHQNSWTRTDCMTCHEEGVKDAPKLKHTSLPDVAKEAKCRTCHVFVAGSQPNK